MNIDLTTLSLDLNFGLPGPAGPAGPAGGEASIYTAAVILGGHRVVYLTSSATLDYADSTNPAHANLVIGITLDAAASGAPVSVQHDGLLIDPSFTFTVGMVYVGTNGMMTQTPPTSGFLQVVGIAINATTLFVNLQEPIFLN